MAKTDWKFNDMVTETDMNELGQEVNEQAAAIGDMPTVPTEAKDAAGAIGELHGELDEMKSDSRITVPIKTGAQTIQGGNVPALVFPKIEGRTLINMLGDLGNLEELSKVIFYQSTGVLDSINKTVGNYGVKATILNGFTLGVVAASASISYKANRYYILLADVKNSNCEEVFIQTASSATTKLITTADSSKFSTVATKFSPTTDIIGSAEVVLKGVAGQVAYVDALRVYEITATEYYELDTMNGGELGEKYPYLGKGIYGVGNPVITSIQNNLLPDFNDWRFNAGATAGAGISLLGPNSIILDATESPAGAEVVVQLDRVLLEPNTSYVLNNTSTSGYMRVRFDYKDGTANSRIVIPPNTSRTFITTINTIAMAVLLTNISGYTDENNMATYSYSKTSHTYTDVSLIKGAHSQSVKRQRQSSSTSIVELYSNGSGSHKDSVQYISGQLKKIKKLEKIVLDGSLPWNYHSNAAGYKIVAIQLIGLPAIKTVPQGYLTKYDGKPCINDLGGVAVWPSNDYWQIGNSTYDTLFISVASSDSGWGNSYTPTIDEIKAYFNGWRMYIHGGSPAVPYNGSGTKSWVRIIEWDNATPNNVPTIPSGGVYKNYQLLYQLLNSSVENIQTKGAVVLEQGDNTITLSTNNVPIFKASLTYAENLHAVISDLEREVAKNDLKVSNTKIMPDGFNVDALIETGKYSVYNAINAPRGNGICYYDVIKHYELSNYGSQVAYFYGSNQIWTRRKLNDMWTKWEEVTGKLSKTGNESVTGVKQFLNGLSVQAASVPPELASPGCIYADGANGMLYYHDLSGWKLVYHSGFSPYVAGGYTGNGAAVRDISLPFTPSSVLVMANNGATLSGTSGFGGLSNTSVPVNINSNLIVQNGTNKFTIFFNSSNGQQSNNSSYVYNFIAFR
ncbi:hypothetical protein BBD42_14735 [Paenibacillus sp. BIHB 4019]|uniref:Tail fiber protein n=1 Tax=Paenibacillus sp. BIHB 4019 TaxID=1870819 RepID=A0A1B2DIM6_9BACL|nr:pyocin knob domain-containing protein [Paenibacillus sp. BIHB 4019]ANY67590.1 hypothetical protein BBD42_14735 [Paenibacillus sp. BIHB 4019]